MAPPAGVRRDSLTHTAFGSGPESGADMDVPNDSPGQDSVNTAAESNSGERTERAPKRIRLNLACNQCRKRKVRCDAEIPKCRNCWLRDEDCETTDPRHPEAGPVVVRKWATKDGLLPGQNPAATHRNQAYVPKHISASPQEQPNTPGPQNSPQNINATALGTRHEATGRSPNDWATTSNFGPSRTPSNGNSGTGMDPSGDTNISRPPDLRTQSWVSKAYNAAAHGQGSDPHHEANGQHPDIVINTDDNSGKVKYLGGSSLQCLTVFLDMHLRRRRLPTVTPCFREGMRFVEEFDLPLKVTIPNLPDLSIHNHIDTFFTKIWPIIPVIDREFVSAEWQRLQRKQIGAVHNGGLGQVMTKQDVPSIVSIFAMLAIGADETAGFSTDFGNSYVDAAYSLYGHLVASPYLPSVQALILLGFALRGKSKDGQCWHLNGQAIRIAHSIGLHRYISPRTRQANKGTSESCASDQLSTENLPLEARVWWSCYAIERLMELETGRPSALTEQEIDQINFSQPQNSGDSVTGPLHLFVLWVSLARIMGQISEHLYHRRISDPWQLLYETGRLDQLLLEWVKAVPEGIKPGHELVHLGIDAEDAESGHQHQHIAAFLSLQYYQAQITLFRASLAFPTQKYLEEIRTRNATRRLPSYPRLLQSQNLSIAAARAMARQVLEIADHVVSSKNLFAPTQPFLAAVVLGLNVLKNPGKRMIRSDVELLVGTTEYIELFYRRMGQSPEFIKGCERLRNSILEAVALERQSPARVPRKDSQAAEEGALPFPPTIAHSNEDVCSSGENDIHMSGIDPLMGLREDAPFFEADEEITLEQLWTSMSADLMMGQPLDFN